MNEQEISARFGRVAEEPRRGERRRAYRAVAAGQRRERRAQARQLRPRKKNDEFVSVELDVSKAKFRPGEMTVNRQDPDFLSSQVDSAADSMRQTEKAVSELQHLTGLQDQLEDRHPILETDLRQCSSMTPETTAQRRAELPPWFPIGPSSSRISTFPARPRLRLVWQHAGSGARQRPRAGAIWRARGVPRRTVVRAMSLVLHYDLGRGLQAFAGRDEQRLKEMVALANRKVGDLSALSKDPAAAFAALDRIVRDNVMAAETDRVSVAVIMDQASYIFPEGEPGRLNLQASSELVTMLNWAMSPHVKSLNMAFVLVDEKLAAVSDRSRAIRTSPRSRCPLPNEADRLEFIQTTIGSTPIERLSDFPAAELAKLTAGIALTDLNVLCRRRRRTGSASTPRLRRSRNGCSSVNAEACSNSSSPSGRWTRSWDTRRPKRGFARTRRS